MPYSLTRRSSRAGVPRRLRQRESRELEFRRIAMGASLLGMASMAAVTLFQLGVVRHLPDPPIDGFDSDRVNAPERASLWGIPDGFYGMTAHAVTLALTAAWTSDQPRRPPWLPLLAAGFALGQAIASGWELWRRPKGNKAWSAYRLVDAAAHVTTAGLMVPAALRRLCRSMLRC